MWQPNRNLHDVKLIEMYWSLMFYSNSWSFSCVNAKFGILACLVAFVTHFVFAVVY